LERLKDYMLKQSKLLRKHGIRIAPESKGDEKDAREAMREMQILHVGSIRGPGMAHSDAKDGGTDQREPDAPAGVVAPALGPAQLAPGSGGLVPMPPAEPAPGDEVIAAPLPVEVPPTNPPAMNGSIPLRFERLVPPGDGPPPPVVWGQPIFGIAFDARIGPQPVGVLVYAVPVDWLDGLDRLVAMGHVATNNYLETYMREGILYTASGRARLYLAPPTNLTLREPPRERRHDKAD
jgi:hypothetical protein